MGGAMDLEAMLAGLTVSRRPGTFVVASTAEPVSLGSGVHAVIAEAEGITVVADRAVALRNGWSSDFECAWLTLDVHSALEAVGLTAAVSRVLADQGIACNVVAGNFHDHLLVPIASVDAAVAALASLSPQPGFSIRPWQPEDVDFLWEMLYQSLHVRAGADPFPRSIVDDPAIAPYLTGFGDRHGDDAFICTAVDGKRIGAAWCRTLPSTDPGFGFVADDVPELGMAVATDWRGRGIGRRLLEALLERHPTMSLSVDEENAAAIAMYRSVGFVTVARAAGSHTMLRVDPKTASAPDAAPALTLDEFVALETRVWQALEAGDRSADLDLLAEDFVGVYPSGFADRGHHAGQLDAGPTVAHHELSEARMFALGDAEVMLCYRADYARPGTDRAAEAMYVSSLWTWRSGRWLNVFSQDTVADAAYIEP